MTAGREPKPGRGPLVVFVAAAVAGVALSANVASGRPILASRWSLLGELGLWGVAWLIAVAAAFRLPRRAALLLILGAGLAVRLAGLAGPPATSDDLYRYSWDGRVQAAGLDPYAQAPDSGQLVRLRESWLWPDAAGCATLDRGAGCTRINRPSDRTIYPPVAEAWFAAAYRVGGIGSRHKLWQVAGLLTELATLGLLPIALRRFGGDVRWTALYALCPAPVLEIVNNGHVDGLGVVFTVAALLVLAPPPTSVARLPDWARDVLAGLLLGAAALVKLYPALVLVAVVGTGRGRRLPALLRAGVTAGALTALTYLPHVVSVGPKVLGYLPGYLREEHYRGGGRFLIAGALGVPASLAGVASVLGVTAVIVWVLVRRPPAPVGAAALLGAVFLATSPVQPWYAVSLLALATIARRPWWGAVVVAGYPYFFAVILDYRHTVGLGRAVYLAALVAVVTAAVAPRLARRPVTPYPPEAPTPVAVPGGANDSPETGSDAVRVSHAVARAAWALASRSTSST